MNEGEKAGTDAPARLAAGTITDERAEDIDHAENPRPHPSRMSTPRFSNFSENQERVDIDRTTLDAILEASSKIQDIQKRSTISTLGLAHESYKDKQVRFVVSSGF